MQAHVTYNTMLHIHFALKMASLNRRNANTHI